MDAIWNLEIAVIVFLQHLGAVLAEPMRLLSFLGTENFFILFMPILYWCLDAGLGLRLGITLIAGDSFYGVAKMAFHSPRPYWFSTQVQALSTETSFGFPSGHATNAAGIWGMVAAKAPRRWMAYAAIALIFLIGLSRIMLGVHFISDVLAGWLLGLAILWAILKWERPVGRWFTTVGLGWAILTGFGLSLVVIGAHLGMHALFSAWPVPEAWLANAGGQFDPFDLAGAYTNAGLLFGLPVGAVWMHTRGGFNAQGTLVQRLLRLLLGLVGVAVIYLGLKAIFPDTLDLLGASLRYLRYALLAAWVSGIGPALFVRLGLAQPAHPLPTQARPQPGLARRGV